MGVSAAALASCCGRCRPWTEQYRLPAFSFRWDLRWGWVRDDGPPAASEGREPRNSMWIHMGADSRQHALCELAASMLCACAGASPCAPLLF